MQVMPEMPDIELYVVRLAERLVGQRLETIKVWSPFVLRTVSPSVPEFIGQKVARVSRLGKRVVVHFEDDLIMVIHLMISGRFVWADQARVMGRPGGKNCLFSMLFSSGCLSLPEFSHKKRASLHLIRGADALTALDRGGIDVFSVDEHAFAAQLRTKNRTLKRALTDPTLIDGIGNAYSDEILLAARLSPFQQTQSLSDTEFQTVFSACRETLEFWRARLLEQHKDFPSPKDVTAFRPDFGAHGKFGKPCPYCRAPIQRIQYAENETNYCARCQNEGRMYADRSLSRLLKDDWPKTVEELIQE